MEKKEEKKEKKEEKKEKKEERRTEVGERFSVLNVSQWSCRWCCAAVCLIQASTLYSPNILSLLSRSWGDCWQGQHWSLLSEKRRFSWKNKGTNLLPQSPKKSKKNKTEEKHKAKAEGKWKIYALSVEIECASWHWRSVSFGGVGGFLVALTFSFFFFSFLSFSFSFSSQRMCQTAIALVLGLGLVISTGLVKYTLCLLSWISFFALLDSFLLPFVFIFFFFFSAQTDDTDQAALMAFWNGLTNTGTLDWNTTASLCGQKWVSCSGEKVYEL